MPVTTRSRIFNDGRNDPISEQRIGSRLDQEDKHSVDLALRNPHHRLKEKMRALTLLYEQQKQASAALKNESLRSEEFRFSTHPSVELSASCKNEEKKANVDRIMRENVIPSAAINRASVQRQPPTSYCKENMEVVKDQIQGLPYPRKSTISTTVKRKLSMEVPAVVGVKSDQEIDELRSDLKKKDMEASRILVFVRLRPMAAKEKEVGSHCCVKMLNRREVYLTEFTHENDYLRLKRLRGRHFTFDACFPETTSQQEVYSTTTAELVESVLQGRNGTVFCYGATGAGKTYTMLGTVESPGVMVLAIKDLFTKIRQRSCDGNHVVHLSYIEVYNETVRDLLAPGRPLVLREDKQGIVAAGLTQYRAYSTDEVMALLQQGNLNRTTEPTRMNETSSRSHAILQVMVEYRVEDMAMNVINKIGKLSLIDLAGSERALATDQRTLRSLEGANINRSLLALSSCINALVEGKKHIPFRNSKLTQLLKDSLGGACNTVMIANISPSYLSFGETQNTLHWADRAKEIRTKAAEVNEEAVKLPGSESEQAKLLLELQKENRELRVQLARQQQKLLTFQAQTMAANASPTPSSVTSLLTPPSSARPPKKQKPRSSFLAQNCFTPNSKKRDEAGRELHRTVKSLEAELERMKKDHSLQLKQKDDIIKVLSKKCEKQLEDGRAGKEGIKKVVKRGSLWPKETSTGELRGASHRFKSPAPAAKKRSFWDITTANSPSVATLNGRKTRSFVANQSNAAPSLLLQPWKTEKDRGIGRGLPLSDDWDDDEEDEK